MCKFSNTNRSYHKHVYYLLHQIAHLNISSIKKYTREYEDRTSDTLHYRISHMKCNIEGNHVAAEYGPQQNLSVKQEDKQIDKDSLKDAMLDDIANINFDLNSECFSEILEEEPPSVFFQHRKEQEARQSNTPTFGQIQSCINMLAAVDPQMFTPQAINIFYQRLFNKLASKHVTLSVNGVKGTMSQAKTQMERSNVVPVQNNNTFGFSTIQQPHIHSKSKHKSKKYLDKLQKEKKLERKIIVNAFCNGEGLDGAQAEMKRLRPDHYITKNIYDASLAEVVFKTYQALEKIAGQANKILNSRAKAIIIRACINCKRYLSPQNCQSLFNVMRDLVNGIVRIKTEEGLNLLNAIQNARYRLTQKARKERQGNEENLVKKDPQGYQQFNQGQLPPNKKKFELHSNWCSQYEQKMIEMYRDGAQMSQIRDYFKNIYPQKEHLFEVVPLRSMLFKLVRVGIRKVSREAFHSDRQDLPKLVKLDDQLVKNIVNCVECFQLRRMILELHTIKGAPRELISKIINAINYYNDCGGAYKKSEAVTMGRDNDRMFL